MTTSALRGWSLLVAGLVLASRGEAATAPVGVWSSDSPRYGKTTITMPSIYYSVKVDAKGTVTALSGSTIKIEHEEGGLGCHKCDFISALFNTVTNDFGAGPNSPSGDRPNLCNFTWTFEGAYPAVPSGIVSRERSELQKACRARPAGTSTVVVPHPLFTNLHLSISYGAGGNFLGALLTDRITYPSPNISITCEACPAIVFQKKVVELRADAEQSVDLETLVSGGVPPLSFSVVNVPKGMVQQGTRLTGRPFVGTYLATITANGGCLTGQASGKDGVSFVVKYAPIVLASQTATPNSLPKEGGVVKLEAKVTSAQLVVTAVRAKANLGAKTTPVPLSLASGTNKNGTWSATWSVPANTTQDWLKYGILFEATDGDGKTTLITGNNLIEVKVAPLPSKPSGTAAPSTAPKPPPAPVIPKLPPPS